MPDLNQLEDMLYRIDRICDGKAGPDDLASLEHILHTNDGLCWNYICYSHLCAHLRCGSDSVSLPETGDAVGLLHVDYPDCRKMLDFCTNLGQERRNILNQ